MHNVTNSKNIDPETLETIPSICWKKPCRLSSTTSRMDFGASPVKFSSFPFGSCSVHSSCSTMTGASTTGGELEPHKEHDMPMGQNVGWWFGIDGIM